MQAAQMTNARKTFGEVVAVSDVSFEVFAGEIFGLLGPNGAGKTTCIRLLLNIFQPDRGEISVLDGPMTADKKNRIGYLPEERGLYRDVQLETVLLYLASLKGMDARTANTEMNLWLDRFELTHHRGKKIKELSRGMQQKAQIIATLIHDPDLIIIDEPFSGLDPVNTRLIKSIMEELKGSGKAILMSTHQLVQVEALCTRIALIHLGETVLYGSVEDIKRDHSGNAIILEGTGDFTGLPGVLDTRREDGLWHLTLKEEASSREIFQSLAHRGVDIQRFEIAEPSLDDIFISVVENHSIEASHAYS